MAKKETASSKCESCKTGCGEAAQPNALDISNLGIEDLRAYAKSQTALVEALVSENDSLIAEVEKTRKEVEKTDTYLAQLTTMKKDFENYKRRNEESQGVSYEQGKVFAAEKILPILDTFKRAEEAVKSQAELEMVKLLVRQFEKTLGEIGLEEVEVLGEDFDPNVSFAIINEETSEQNKGKVLEVYSKGYKYKDRVIRFSQVKVGI